MNAVEIEEAISQLAEQPFDAANFPYAFLEAFGNKETTIKRIKNGGENKSDVPNGVLQRNNIHLAVCQPSETRAIFEQLRSSAATEKFKAKFILATDGNDFEAEDLTTGETLACRYADFPNHFGFFLSLAGISTVKQIRESSFDIRATSRLNRLYVELLKNNPDWSTAERRHDMNHFMARLIFCFFAEDTDIFNGKNLFTATIEQMSAKDASDIDWVISEIFRAMNTPIHERATSNFRPWADAFPYVNGGLFSGSTETPKFTKIARSYLLHVGSLDWTKINPDIFGSMIQAVADDEERGALGMHYTSVPNILKVLNPLFLDNLRAELEAAGDNTRKLLNLRKRMAHIRVFDPACGSGNFLVIAYKQMREIEAEINKRRGEEHLKSEISIRNYRGIELRSFSAEIARLALIIAEYQCDVVYIGQKEALQAFLPLDSQNWITNANALEIDWVNLCGSTGTGVKLVSDDLFNTPLDQAYIASVGEEFIGTDGRKEYRLRVIFDNGVESNQLMRSLQKRLWEDEAGRRITDPSLGPLFDDLVGESDVGSGTIYVLRSKSEHPDIKKNANLLHKIGVTGGNVSTRIANAKLDPTFLMADVEVVASYELFNINRVKLENLIHRFFDSARLNIQINDRFGNPINPREWFLVPFFIIDEVVERIKDGSLHKYRYVPHEAKVIKVE